MSVTVLGGILLTLAICDAVLELLDFVLEKRGKRLRVDPQEKNLLEKDQEIAGEVARRIRTHFSGDIGMELKGMPLEERVKILSQIAEETALIMDLDKPELEFVSSDVIGAKIQGSYLFSAHKLLLNIDYINVSEDEVLFDALDTIVHEMSHAYQQKKMSEMLEQMLELGENEEIDCNPDTMRTAAWLINIKNYIKFEVDPARYRKQPLEAYAFAMANVVLLQLSEGSEK